MANKNCDACSKLQEDAAEFVQNGVTTSICNSLKNNTGFNTSSDNDNCTDLDYANDCLIGNMEDALEAYDVCSWKKFMKDFIHNLWNVLKAMICSMCGLWAQTEKQGCELDFLMGGQDVSGKLTEDDFVAGTGVSFDRTDSQAINLSLTVRGNIYTTAGSIKVDLTNSHWANLGLTNHGEPVSGNVLNTPDGNYTIAIVKLKKSKFPWLRSLSSTVGTFVNAGVGQLFVQAVDGDSDSNTYAGQWGNASGRNTVPAGYIYVRISLVSLTTWGIERDVAEDADKKANVTFRATGMANVKRSGIEC